MSRCADCKYDECDAAAICYDTCPMYTEYNVYTHCKCIMYNFDEYEDCPYFVSKKEEQ